MAVTWVGMKKTCYATCRLQLIWSNQVKWLMTISMLLIISLSGQGQGPGFDAQGDALPPGALARLGSLRFRHDAPITCQAITHDIRLIATGGGRSIRIWDAATGRQKFALTMVQNNRAVIPTAVAFSVDGHQIKRGSGTL